MKRSFYIVTISFLFAFILAACSPGSEAAYEASPEATLQAVLADDYLVSPEEAGEWNGDAAYQFVDLRSPAMFSRGHIDGAVNIPTQNLLEPANKEQLSADNKTFILYADTELAANGPWMLLRQLGYDNVKVLQGGYGYWTDWEQDGEYLTETALYPYDSLFTLAVKRTQMEEEALRAKPVVVDRGPAPAPKKEVVPKKKPVVEEEEEGC